MSAPERIWRAELSDPYSLEFSGSLDNRVEYVRADIHEALATRLAEVERARDEARQKLFPHADANPICGFSYGGFNFISDEKGIKEFRRLENNANQIAVWRRVFDENIEAYKDRATTAETALSSALAEAEAFRGCLATASGKLQVALAENERLKAAAIDALVSLVAATSLLKRGGKKAAPSDKMFNQMVKDYEASIAHARTALNGGTTK